MQPKVYNTPERHCVIKTRLTEAERTDFEQRCATLSMIQSEYIRQAIFYSRITPVMFPLLWHSTEKSAAT